MKVKHLSTIIVAALISVFVLTFSVVKIVDNSNHYGIDVTIRYSDNSYDIYKMEAGDSLLLLKTPVKEGYEFLGWYEDSAYTVEFDFDKDIKKDTTIYAKMEKI